MTTLRPQVNVTGRYSFKEAAEHLGVHPITISRWTKAGKLRAGIHKATLHPYITGLEILRFWNT